MNIAELAPVLEQALRATRGVVQAAFAKPAAGRLKPDGSTVTDLDVALEQQLGGVLLDLDPSWGVVGEESGVLRPGEPTWHLDPVDGTANFARRSALFASQLVLMDGSTPLFGAVYEPLRDDYTWAARGAGAWREGRRLQVADPEPARAVLYLDVADTGIFVEHTTLVPRLRAALYKIRLLGSIALQLRDVAAGVADGYLSGRGYATALHDLAPGLLICREAGAVDSDGSGGDPLERRDTLVLGTARVHDAVCAVLHAST